MQTYEFRLVGSDTSLGTKELEKDPPLEEDVVVEGKTYRVETVEPSRRSQPTIVRVRKPLF